MIVYNILNLIVMWCCVINMDVRSHRIVAIDRSRLPPFGPIVNKLMYPFLIRRLCGSLNNCPMNAVGNPGLDYVINDKTVSEDGSYKKSDRQSDSNTLHSINNINNQLQAQLQLAGLRQKTTSQQFSSRLGKTYQEENEKATNTKLLSLLDSILDFVNYKVLANNNENLPQIQSSGGEALHRTIEAKLPLLSSSEKQSLSEILADLDKMYNSSVIQKSMPISQRSTRSTLADVMKEFSIDNVSHTKSKSKSIKSVVTKAPISWIPYSSRPAIGTTSERSQTIRGFAANSSVPPVYRNIQWKPATRVPSVTSSTSLASSSIPRNEQENLRTTIVPIRSGIIEKIPLLQKRFAQALDLFERNFYMTTFTKLSSISPQERRENGISFVESGLFLYLILSALSLDLDQVTRTEIDKCLALLVPDEDKIEIVQRVLNSLPVSNDGLKFRWSTRLIVNGSRPAQDVHKSAKAIQLRVDHFNGTETPEEMMNILNNMVEKDSGGAMRNTFEEDELSDGVQAVLISTVYVRARWRTSPTLLNGTRVFRDADGTAARSATMIRVNDLMRYADLADWDAEALEIPYSTPGLSLLMLVPRGRSLRLLSERAANVSLSSVINQMKLLRVAATLPIYTLRMTLLLPNKLEAMGISRLVDTSDSEGSLRLSHAIQRLMFWAEAGRNAFKDDGIEWDIPPQLELVIDRPYLFFVRWHNVTLMNGNFVL